jgi:KDO2-lipid IV(A) lauroyltransferase
MLFVKNIVFIYRCGLKAGGCDIGSGIASIREGRRKDKSRKEYQRMHLFAAIPKGVLCFAGKTLGMIIYYLDIPHRRIVVRNLKFAFPEWNEDEIAKTARRVFWNLGVTIFEIIQMAFYSKEDFLRNIKITGEEHLLKAVGEGKGVIIISAHLGNWEAASLFSPSYFGYPVTVVARNIESGVVNKAMVKLRSRFGNSVIDKEGALPEMTQTLRKGKILALLMDQGTKKSEGVELLFFGKKVTVTPAAAMLSLRCKSPVLPVFCVRDEDHRLEIIVYPPVHLLRTGDLRDDLKTNTQIMTDIIEKAVRTYPDQWLWLHKRWKRFYPELYPEYIERRKKRRAKKTKKMLSEKKTG